jgi:hypothetical protein
MQCKPVRRLYKYLGKCIDQLSYKTANEITKPDIDTFVQDLSNAIVYLLINCQSYSIRNKPYWNDKLKKLSKQSKEAWHIWMAAGKPRGFRFKKSKCCLERNYGLQSDNMNTNT